MDFCPPADNFFMLRASHVLMLAVAALLGLAVVMVHSAGMTVAAATEDTSDESLRLISILSGRTAIYACIAIVVMLLASRINIRRWVQTRGMMNPLQYVVLAALTLQAMTFVPGISRSVNGSSRWITVGPESASFSFQPSEVVKWVLVVAIAWWCSRRRIHMHQFWRGMFPPLFLVAIACGMIVLEDLGTAALIGGVAMVLLLAGGASWWKLAALVPPAAGTVYVAIVQSPYRVERLMAFQNPWADPQGIGYHPIQSMVAIAQGGVIGRGLGNGIQKFGYLPEDTTDFIYAIICEEMGFGGAALVVGLYMIIIWVGLSIVRDCRDTFGRLLGVGVLLTIAFQATINIAVVTVVVPTKGIALPFVSSGGTGWIMTAAMVGLVASLERAREPVSACTPVSADDEKPRHITHAQNGPMLVG